MRKVTMPSMDDERWKEPDDLHLDWRVPRSLREVRERWANDALLRVFVGIAVALFLAGFISVYFGALLGRPA